MAVLHYAMADLPARASRARWSTDPERPRSRLPAGTSRDERPVGVLPFSLLHEPISRRDLLGLSSLWMTAGSMLFALVGALRLPRAAVLDSPSKRVRLSLPEALAAGTAFVPPGRSMAVFRDTEGVFAISTVCTHLGCIVRPTAEGFECPCHGSRFAADGATALVTPRERVYRPADAAICERMKLAE